MLKRLLQTKLALALLLILLPLYAFSDTVTLTILHTTDLHGQVYSAAQYDGVVRGGLDRVSALVKKERMENGHVLLLDNGDSIQGNSMAFLFKGEHIIRAMNAMGYDAMAIGNHEFNFGPDVLAARMWESDFPWLGANFYRVNPATGNLWRPVPGSVIREIAGLKVAIVGAFVQDIPNWEQPAYIKNMVFEGVLETAREEVRKVRQEADLVVVLAHTGVRSRSSWKGPGPYDPGSAGEAMAKAIPEMDVLICGHSHRVVAEETINGVLVTQAGYWGGALGKVTVEIEKRPGGGASVVSKKAEAVEVTPDMPQDPEILEILKPFEEKWKAWASEKVGEIAEELDFRQSRVSEPDAVRLIHRALLEATGADISFHVAFNNSSVLPAGPVTNQDVFDIYFYDNALFVLSLTGRQIKQALEVSARSYNTWNFMTAGGGLTWTLDMGRPAGERVANVRFRGEPLRDEQVLNVAVNHYNAVGGGGYEVLRGAIETRDTGKWVRDAIADTIRRHSPARVSELAGEAGLTVVNAPETAEPEPAANY